MRSEYMVVEVTSQLLVDSVASLHNVLQTQILGIFVAYHQANYDGRVPNYSGFGNAKLLQLKQTLIEGESFSPVV